MSEKQFDVKVIACDIDHTLTDKRGRISLKAIEKIRYLEDNGIRVVLLTSRDFMTAASLSTWMGSSGMVAAEDGGVVGSLDAILRAPILVGDIRKIEEGLRVLQQTLGDRVILFNWPGRQVSYVLARAEDYTIAEGNAILTEHGLGVRLLDSGVAYLLVDVNCDKGRGLRELAKMMGLMPENFAAIGDNFNDLPMFNAAGYSVAVGNAPEAVKEQVDYACQANYGDGFCEGVDHILTLFKPDWR
jgi:phosphoglycolate phosphatase (TIGR01487 family)